MRIFPGAFGPSACGVGTGADAAVGEPGIFGIPGMPVCAGDRIVIKNTLHVPAKSPAHREQSKFIANSFLIQFWNNSLSQSPAIAKALFYQTSKTYPGCGPRLASPPFPVSGPFGQKLAPNAEPPLNGTPRTPEWLMVAEGSTDDGGTPGKVPPPANISFE